nr:hypothetical protein CFP56_28735 [Quercus suber]
MPSLSPAAVSATGSSRPQLGRRHNSHTTILTPVSNESSLRHTVARPNRHAKVVLPRNASSGRNLAKLARQQQQQQHIAVAEDSRRHARQRSHEGDTAIRLPGSLDDSQPPAPPPMRRNLTSYQLPRANSHVKLKKNLSHGALTRLGSTKNMAVLNSISHKAPPSPGLKGRSKRPKSADLEKDLHEQEVELLRQRTEAAASKRVGFDVGSEGDSDVEDMEDSGTHEDEWTEESTSASPYSTRQNTANNSRRTSVVVAPEKARQRPSGGTHPAPKDNVHPLRLVVNEPKEQQAPAEDTATAAQTQSTTEEESDDSSGTNSSTFAKQEVPAVPQQPSLQQQPPNAAQRSPLHAAKDYPSEATRRILNRSQQLPAPALISNVSAMDNFHSSTPSQMLHREEVPGSQEEEELVSRFMPSASHPSMGSGINTAAPNTPMPGSYQTPDEEQAIHAAHKPHPFQTGLQTPTSPGSIRSSSSGAVTPAMGRSRTELRMLADKALADREEAAERSAAVPYHVFDRRNEFMKARRYGRDGGYGEWSKSSQLGSEFFQGRFNAVNQELRVVETFRNPYAESIQRLRLCKASFLNTRTSPQKQHAAAAAAALKVSKSAVALHEQTPGGSSRPAASTSPPANTALLQQQRAAEPAKSDSPSKPAMLPGARSSMHIKNSGSAPAPPDGSRRGVSFAGAPRIEPRPGSKQSDGEEASLDALARELWESVLG